MSPRDIFCFVDHKRTVALLYTPLTALRLIVKAPSKLFYIFCGRRRLVDGLSDDILSVNRAIDSGATVAFGPRSSYVEWADDGSCADFSSQGNQFEIALNEELDGTNGSQAAINDPDAEAVMDYARRQMERDDTSDEENLDGDEMIREGRCGRTWAGIG
eukprot:s3200_g8.t1